MSEKIKITKDSLIAEALEKSPKSLDIFLEYGLHCAMCGMAAWETIEQWCLSHGFSEKEIEDIVKELNEMK